MNERKKHRVCARCVVTKFEVSGVRTYYKLTGGGCYETRGEWFDEARIIVLSVGMCTCIVVSVVNVSWPEMLSWPFCTDMSDRKTLRKLKKAEQIIQISYSPH